jgi:S-adenosylmethionine synthetase
MELFVEPIADPLPGARALEIVSQIGAPIGEPQVVGLRLATGDGRPPATLTAPAGEIVRAGLSHLAALSDQLASDAIDLY